MPKTTVTFLGAAQTVTGSKYLVQHGDYRLLVDCGVFQGSRELRSLNWKEPPFDPKSIDAVLLTHAHIDHTGSLPRLVKQGLKCPVYSTAATRSLCKILLRDSGRLQEQEARYRSSKGQSRHKNPDPLYTEKDAKKSLRFFKKCAYDTPIKLKPDIQATFTRAGHILGAACITLECGSKKISFSGDLGRYDVPILVNPETLDLGNLLLIESTYGTRSHTDYDPREKLAKVIRDTVARGGCVVIPSFAVGRAQLLLYYLRELKELGKIPNIPIVVDSPMATNATRSYQQHPECYDAKALKTTKPFTPDKLAFVTSQSASIRLNKVKKPFIIISPSGMLHGGRILHHLKHRIGNPDNTILFVGHQPSGGRGAWILSGADELRLFGRNQTIRAKIENMGGLSAHAGKNELIRWASECSSKPDQVAVVHGEKDVSIEFGKTLEKKLRWNCYSPELFKTIEV